MNKVAFIGVASLMVGCMAVNFYSPKDHVLELFPTNVIGVTDGYENWDQMFERYSWQKQELWKGRKGVLARMGTTDWSGWGIRKDWPSLFSKPIRCLSCILPA